MDIVFITLLIAFVVALIIIGICIKRISQLVGYIEELNARVEESIDVLADAHRDIIESAGAEVASDDIFTRKVVRSLFNARDAVHKVAEKLASFDKSETSKK